MHHYEQLRESYRPESIGKTTEVVLVAESRPANGTFFYTADSCSDTRRKHLNANMGARLVRERTFLPTFKSEGSSSSIFATVR